MQLGTKELAIQHVHCVITLVATKLPRFNAVFAPMHQNMFWFIE